MTTLSSDVAIAQSEQEWNFCVSLFYGADDIARQECPWLEPALFINAELGAYWKKILDGEDKLAAANDLNLSIELFGRGTQIPNVTRPEEYARAISNVYYLRQVAQELSDIARAVKDKDVSKVKQKIGKLDALAPACKARIFTPQEIDIEFRQKLVSGFPMVKTHLPSVDNIIGGLFGGELSILAAATSMGKSALAMQFARNVANDKERVLFFSLEMARMQLWARMACPLAGYSWIDVRAGKVDANGLQLIANESEKLQRQYGDYLLVQDEVRTLPEMHQLVAQYKPRLVIVDYLEEINWHDPSESKVDWYGKACRFMRNYFSRSIGAHTMVVHQVGRDVGRRKDKIPTLADLKWSSDLEQAADEVFFGHREDYWDRRATNLTKVPFELWVAKNRQGARTGCATLEYDLKQQWFSEYQVYP